MKWLNQSTAKGFAMPFFPKKAKKRSPVASFDQSFVLEPILTPSGIVDGSDDTDPSALALTLTVDLDDINTPEENSGEVDNDTDTDVDSPEVDIPDSPEISDNLLNNPISETELELLSFITSELETDPISESEPLEGITDEIATLDSESTDTVEDISENSLDGNEAESDTEISDSDTIEPVDEISESSLDAEEVASDTETSDNDTTTPVDGISEDSVDGNETDIASEKSEISSTEDTSHSDRIESLSEETSLLETDISDSVLENSIKQTTSVENLSDPESGDAEISINSDTSEVTNGENLPETEADADSANNENSEEIDPLLPSVINPQTDFTFESGVFTVGETGVVGIDYLFDGGGYQGELAMFSLEGMNEFEPGSEAFIQEAARRALSQSELGYVVVSDLSEAARFKADLPHEGDFNYGEYLGVRTFTMRAGDKLAFMLTPNGTVQQISESPGSGGDVRPLFSLTSANPNDLFHAGQIADVTGEGNTFVFEDLRVDGNSDRDYNDIVFQVRGARGEATLMDQVIDPSKDWRGSDMGQALLAYTQTYITPDPVDSGLPDLLGELDDLDALLNPPVEAEQPDISAPVSPDLDADLAIDEPEGDNPDAPETDSIEDLETPPSDSPEPIVEDNSEGVGETREASSEPVVESNSESDAVSETPEASPEPVVKSNSEGVGETSEASPEPVVENTPESDAVSETPEISPEPAVEDNSEADSVGETPSEQLPESNSEDSPSAGIGEESSVEDGENNSTPDSQENTANQDIDTPDYPPIDIPQAINSSEFVTRIENLTTSLRNPEVASAVGSEAEVMALTNRLERLTQTLSRQETVTPESAIAINNLLNRVEILSSPPTPSPVTLVSPPNFTFAPESQPLVGVIDTGFSGNNPDIDYSRVTLGRDWVNNDSNPLLESGEGSEHGTHILGTIGATQDNGLGIDGINDQAPLWLGRAIGSGKWADSLVEFVDAAKESGQPNAVVNLSLDLTQINPDGSVTTRYEFTPQERAAIEYARQHNVLIVVASGNDGGVMSALGQASQEFDNIITVGAAERVNDAVALSKAYDRTNYSSYGYGVDIMAPGGSIDNPELSLTGDSVGTMAGSSVATAKVTGAVSQVWAANPSLSYRQVIEIIKNTATDLKETGWDLESGAGLLNIAAAVHLAKVTKPEYYQPEAWAIPDIWSGEGYITPNERAAATEFNGKYYEWESYTIAQGDTLSAIALRTMGNSSAPYYNFIAQKNSLANANFIITGQQILVPKQVPEPVQQPQPPQPQSTSPEDLQPQLVAPQSGEGKVPINSGQFLRTVTSNGVIIHYYTNGHLMVQPSGFQSWYALGSRIVRPPILNLPSPLPAPDGNDTLATARQMDKTNVDLGNGWTPYGLNVSVKGDSIGNLDRYDYYSFTLDRSQYVNLKLDGLRADANLELIQDVNNNGQIDPGEVLGSSRNLGTTSDSITQFLNPGKYYIQTSAGIGNAGTLYNLNLRSWLSVQPDNGPQPINGRQPVTPKIDSVYFSDVTGNNRADGIVINNWGTTTRQSNSNLFLPNETWTEHAYFGSHRSFFADVDGDGKADAIAVNDNIDPQFDGVYIKLSNGSEFLESKKWTDVGYNGKYGTFFADATGDGKADAIVVNDGGVTVRRSDGTRFLPNETWTEVGYGGQFGTYFADVTGDGKADAIVVNDSGVTVRRSDGTRFLPNETWTEVGYWGKYGTFFGDVTGDGKADAIVVNDGGVTVRRSDGTRFLPNETWTEVGYAGQFGTYFADVTGDGKADAIVSNAGGVTVRRSDGSRFLPNETWTNVGYGGEGGPGSIVKGSGPEVYLIDGIKRRHIPDPETLNYLGRITPQNYISDEDLNAFPLGVDLPSWKNGALVKGSGDAVYYMENGYRRHIPDGATFTAMGLNWGSVQNISDGDLNAIPLGSSIPSVISAWQHPLPGYRVTSEYGPRAGNFHYGIDIGAPTGTPVKAAKPGTVVEVGYHPNGWGNFVKINHPDGFQTTYAHLSSINVSRGQQVNGGSTIGRVGSTGLSTGPHLHFEVRVAPYRWKTDNRNPRNYINF